ncbi:MAG TPA: hypothetical protein VLH60_02590 [Sedimentisphaerales bacterium]|nr:hypothetical protein [Sedimentisphaerales bacterium]
MEFRNELFGLAYCGLLCPRCVAFTRGKCKGYRSTKPMPSLCLARKYAAGKALLPYAGCPGFPDLRYCKKLDNCVSKLFDFTRRSNKISNLRTIPSIGLDEFRILCTNTNAHSPNHCPTKPD